MFNRFDLNSEQEFAFQRLNSLSSSICHIVGKKGTGKTYLLKTFINEMHKKIAVVAPNQECATLMECQSIHNYFNMSVGVQKTFEQDSIYRGLTNEIKSKLAELDCLVLIEVSLIRVDIIDMIDLKMRAAKKLDEPFGGCQVILFGNEYESPTVIEQDEEVKAYLNKKYKTLLFNGAPCFKQKKVHIIELTHVVQNKLDECVDENGYIDFKKSAAYFGI